MKIPFGLTPVKVPDQVEEKKVRRVGPVKIIRNENYYPAFVDSSKDLKEAKEADIVQ
eukprot:CAMPEP_0202967720 /NCGR_PEP_ID=MMETSP1396-20130829/12723_1 /ASSEMBLY_ACC=CAM_ASM_000872 /TAXON_ID= /ORGANISM="Pseudokeronopsis sp., Strain Brazil" /LENGTH=56 /DNA_ID=CAMNT_0049693133 /DNA_START=223 /DNA_END=393 /DNA_ORIENTATION=+